MEIIEQEIIESERECIKCGKIKIIRDDVIECCCGFSMFHKHDVDLFRLAGWTKNY